MNTEQFKINHSDKPDDVSSNKSNLSHDFFKKNQKLQDKLNVSNYNSNILRESLAAKDLDSRSSSIRQKHHNLPNSSSMKAKDSISSREAMHDLGLPPKEDDPLDLTRRRFAHLPSDMNNETFSNASMVANYGDLDLNPINGIAKPNLNIPLSHQHSTLSQDSHRTNNPIFDPYGTRDNSHLHLGPDLGRNHIQISGDPNLHGPNMNGGMIFDPFKNKKDNDDSKPGYSGYPGAKYDNPFGNIRPGNGGGSGWGDNNTNDFF